jgi:hypothetical protein
LKEQRSDALWSTTVTNTPSRPASNLSETLSSASVILKWDLNWRKAYEELLKIYSPKLKSCIIWKRTSGERAANAEAVKVARTRLYGGSLNFRSNLVNRRNAVHALSAQCRAV